MVISDIFTQDAQFSCGKFHQLAVERVRADLLVWGRSLGMGEQQCLISWALMLYNLENCDRDQLSPDTASSWSEHSGERIVTAVSVAGAPGVSSQLYTSLLAAMYFSHSPLNPESSLGPVPSLTPRP